LQRVAGVLLCYVLHCVAVCCRGVAACFIVLQCVAEVL